ncbi:DUF4139 domain-containing protein [Parasphingopyxis marina]|uniref:DUF4139 domain-containing protein n=1 Tax=Parasphingopyxis marina TaxID=2761622 RepID=A0A842HU62_9SPHN|nr:hypothetical protein [Parasphingopyxis marina]MBC2776073.1 hypothetical protein [Parasphingopyxis marina]
MRRLALILLTLFAASPAAAQVIVSDGPESVAVTLYRDPGRGEGGGINLNALGGFALITETRQIALPAGAATIRFEGVAEGIVPVSAIVTGLPGGTIQRNRDARLLSPASLVDGSLGNRVTIRRADSETGGMREQPATIRVGPNNGVIFETAEGIEALRCSGLPETLVYDGVPEGLSARPTLSVETVSEEAATVTVTLSYLASGFDWTAHYVADLSDDGDELRLFAWLTLANSNPQSFPDADVQAVAGTLNREAASDIADAWQQLQLRLSCWPMDTTATHPGLSTEQTTGMMSYSESPGAIVVTAQRRGAAEMDMAIAGIVAEQEDLGDLKLYRIPEQVTVAANAQKQVALLVQPAVRFERLYTGRFANYRGDSEPEPLFITFRTENELSEGLGVPLPSGTVTVFEQAAGRRLPVSETRLADRAIGQEVELQVVPSAQVILTTAYEGDGDRHRWQLTVTNANPRPAEIELVLGPADTPLRFSGGRTREREGERIWRVTVPANGERSLRVNAPDA